MSNVKFSGKSLYPWGQLKKKKQYTFRTVYGKKQRRNYLRHLFGNP